MFVFGQHDNTLLIFLYREKKLNKTKWHSCYSRCWKHARSAVGIKRERKRKEHYLKTLFFLQTQLACCNLGVFLTPHTSSWFFGLGSYLTGNQFIPTSFQNNPTAGNFQIILASKPSPPCQLSISNEQSPPCLGLMCSHFF